MQSLKIDGIKVYCFDPKYHTYMRMGTKLADIFVKTVEAKHLMIVKNAYGLQYDAFLRFKENGIKTIRIHENHTGNNWFSKVEDWVENNDVADYGRGKQIFLPLVKMHRKLN